MERGIRQVALAIVILGTIALALSSGIVGNTFGLFNGETQNAGSSFAGGWIGAAAGLTTTATGYDVALAWTPGTHGPVTGQLLNGVDNTTNSNCTGAAYGLLTTLATATTATYTDASRGTPANNGDWFCYQLVTTTGSTWTAQTPQVLQLGLVTSSIVLANVGTNNSINANDTITLTFNQRTTLAASGTTKVCVIAGTPGKVIIGDTTGGNSCATGDGYNVGVITGATIVGNQVYRNSTFTTTTAAAPWTMTTTLVGGGTATYSGNATFVPSASILSNATTHQATMCIAAATTCQPTTATHF